jgi:hypothetical protein
MAKPVIQPEILLPSQRPAQATGRFSAAGRIFRDENLDMLAHVLDDCFRIPGTTIRFGIDGIIGLIPGLGDVLAGLASFILIIAAWARGIAYVTLVRMLVNLGIGVLVGAIPLFGDIFDIAWKANRRNYALLSRSIAEPRRHMGRDWLYLLGFALVLLVILAIPIVVVVWLISWLLLPR